MNFSAELIKWKFQILKIDSSLNKYDNIVLIPCKLERANEFHKEVGLQKQWTN